MRKYCLPVLIGVSVAYTACVTDDSPPTERFELPSGARFGMSQDTFFAVCKRGNAAGELTAGRNNLVEAELPPATGIPNGRIAVYPNFVDGEIAELHGNIFSKDFGGWTKALFADSLVDETLAYLSSTYPGPAFESVPGVRPTYRRRVGDVLMVVQPGYSDKVRFVFTDLTRVEEAASIAERLRDGTIDMHPVEYGRAPSFGG